MHLKGLFLKKKTANVRYGEGFLSLYMIIKVLCHVCDFLINRSFPTSLQPHETFPCLLLFAEDSYNNEQWWMVQQVRNLSSRLDIGYVKYKDAVYASHIPRRRDVGRIVKYKISFSGKIVVRVTRLG